MSRPRRLRLSARLTLTFAVGALGVALLLSLSAYYFTYRFLTQQQEKSVLRQAYFNAAVVRFGLRSTDVNVPRVLDALPVSTTGSTSASTVIEHSGRWYSSALVPSRNALPPALRSEVLDGHPARMWTRVNGRPVLIVGVPLPAVNSAFFQVDDVSSIARTLSVLRGVLLATAAAATAAGAGVGWWASRRLTAPLRTVAAAARRIAAGELDTKLPEEADADLAGLVVSFNSMVDALQARIERDARFAADVSHELRSPLTTLTTSMSVLQGRRDELSARGRDALDLLATELARFRRLVDDLLELSRTAAAGTVPDPQPVRIAELLLNLVGEGRYAGVATDVDGRLLDAVVVGDRRMLQQALRNLLDNAEAHAGGAAAVGLRTADGGVEVYVDDAGPGIPVDERDRIFERFARGLSGRRRGSAAGSGLGLALVREYVHAHGGEVHVDDRPGGGTRFVVRLPAEVAT